tara:strand:- start:212 stop:472 length:261 start_codon:yes stop_codon:yes gene_type:complete
MNREELKQMWLNLPTNKGEKKVILLEMDTYKGRRGQGTVQITSDGPNGFKEFKTHQKFPFSYLVEREEYKSGEYELVIKLINGTVI